MLPTIPGLAMNGDTTLRLGPNSPLPPRELTQLLHSDYSSRFAQWSRVRDCIEGEDVIKAKGSFYLPKRAKQSDDSWDADLKRAVFFNATGRTREALLSSIFRRPGVVRLPTGMSAESVTRDGMSVRKVSRWLAEQVITVARAGVLVDLPAGESPIPEPFLSLYPAEHILSWHVEKGVTKMVLLAEQVRDGDATMNMFSVKCKWQCRMLALDEEGNYFQYVGTPEEFSAMRSLPVAKRFYPEVYEKRLREIPFQFFGLVKNSAEVEKPLLLDIANINIHHFLSSATLERARAFVGSPIYTTFTSGKGDETDEPLIVSPELVWEFDVNDKVDILEFSGSGITSLENGQEEKEEQMRVLGARLVGQRKNAAARSANADDAASNSDDASLLDVVESVSEGVTNCLKIVAQWKRLRVADVRVLLNKHFSAPKVGARELRAIDACLNRSLRPGDIFDLLVEGGLISEDQDKDEYVAWIEELREAQEAATRGDIAQPVTPQARPEPSTTAKSGPAPGPTNSG